MVTTNDNSSLVYLISGANRGIGYGLVSTLASRNNTVIYAGTRNPTNSTVLQQLAKQYSNIKVVKLTSANVEDNQAVAQQIEREQGRLDVVIANAGVGGEFATAATVGIDNFKETFEINTLGPLVLFQAVHALLQKSQKPIFTAVSTILGSIKSQQDQEKGWPILSYGASKAALNYVLVKIHQENPDLIAIPIHPGWVQTDMGNGGAKSNGLEKAPVTVEDSVNGIISLIDKAERKTHSGKFFDYQHKEISW